MPGLSWLLKIWRMPLARLVIAATGLGSGFTLGAVVEIGLGFYPLIDKGDLAFQVGLYLAIVGFIFSVFLLLTQLIFVLAKFVSSRRLLLSWLEPFMRPDSRKRTSPSGRQLRRLARTALIARPYIGGAALGVFLYFAGGGLIRPLNLIVSYYWMRLIELPAAREIGGGLLMLLVGVAVLIITEPTWWFGHIWKDESRRTFGTARTVLAIIIAAMALPTSYVSGRAWVQYAEAYGSPMVIDIEGVSSSPLVLVILARGQEGLIVASPSGRRVSFLPWGGIQRIEAAAR